MIFPNWKRLKPLSHSRCVRTAFNSAPPARVEAIPSKEELQSKLDLPGTPLGRCYRSRTQIRPTLVIKRTSAGGAKVWPVEDIEDFRPELQPVILGQWKTFIEGEIHRSKARRNQGVPAKIAEESWRRGCKLAGVEITIRSAQLRTCGNNPQCASGTLSATSACATAGVIISARKEVRP